MITGYTAFIQMEKILSFFNPPVYYAVFVSSGVLNPSKKSACNIFCCVYFYNTLKM